jgi:hypothetical protein
VKSIALPSFWRAYERLDAEVQAQARFAYAKFNADPNHPSLRFKKLNGSSNRWSVRVSDQYRSVGLREGDTMRWFWIGTHNEFDKLFT